VTSSVALRMEHRQLIPSQLCVCRGAMYWGGYDSDDDDLAAEQFVNGRLPKDWTPPPMPLSWRNGEHWIARVAEENGRDAYDEWVEWSKLDWAARLCPRAQFENRLAQAIIRSGTVFGSQSTGLEGEGPKPAANTRTSLTPRPASPELAIPVSRARVGTGWTDTDRVRSLAQGQSTAPSRQLNTKSKSTPPSQRTRVATTGRQHAANASSSPANPPSLHFSLSCEHDFPSLKSVALPVSIEKSRLSRSSRYTVW
jgi:hypothetical protein